MEGIEGPRSSVPGGGRGGLGSVVRFRVTKVGLSLDSVSSEFPLYPVLRKSRSRSDGSTHPRYNLFTERPPSDVITADGHGYHTRKGNTD